MGDNLHEQPLLAKWMKNAALTVGLDVGGKKIGWEEVLVLLSPGVCDHDALYAKVGPLLPERVRCDFEELRAMKTQRQTIVVEAARNRTEAMLYFENWERLRHERMGNGGDDK